MSVRVPRSASRRLRDRACAVVLGWASVVARLQADVLWQIGRPDESSSDLAHWRDPATGQARLAYADPSQDPVFRVGVDDPARHWFAFQPGTANGAAGHRAHPFTVEFDLPSVPGAGACLTLHLLAYSVRLPRIEADVNGEKGWYHQDPRLTYTAGDPAVFYLPHYSKAVVRVPIPRDRLRVGKNRIVLTALDAATGRDDAQPSGFTWPGVSGIVYDALWLETPGGRVPGETTGAVPAQGPSRSPANVQARLEPTIFFTRTARGMSEELDLTVSMDRWDAGASVGLELGRFRWEASLPSGRTHGEARWRVAVPEFEPGTAARVVVRHGSGTNTFAFTLHPARRWTLLLVPNQHLDIGYTDHPAKVSEVQSRALDRALALARERPGFRYTTDGAWVLQEYLRGRTASRDADLLRSIRRGEIEVPAVYASHFTGFASLENLVRSLYPARRLSREHGLPFDVALSTDVPSHSWSWASVLKAANVRFFVAASDAYRAPFLLENRLHEASPFLWQGPDGEGVWTWYARHYHQGSSLLGTPPTVESGEESLPRFLQAYDHAGYPSDAVLLYGTQVENVALDPGHATFAGKWNARHAFPKVEVSTFAGAMRRVTRDAAKAPRVVRGDGGPYWEDGLAAHARITALARATMRGARSAEVFSTAASLAVPGFEADPTMTARLWESVLATDEHTWHADVSVSDPDSLQSVRQGELRDARTTDAARAADHLLARALGAITGEIPNPSRTLVVFNSLSWPRDGWVEADVPKGWAPVDLATGALPALERVMEGNGFHRLRFLARQVPAVGYRCFAVRPMSQPLTPPQGTLATVIETPHHRMELSPGTGGIRSWVERATGREWVDPTSPWTLSQHLYVTGADALPNRLVQYSTVSPEPQLALHGAGGGRLVGVFRHPWGWVARMEATNVHHPRIETTLVLRDDSPVVELRTELEKRAVRTKEAAYVAFPFALPAPRYRHATQNGFVDPAHDLLPGACREWFCIQEWLAAEQGGRTMLWCPVDAPLVTLGDIARGRWPREFGERNGWVFSYVMSNYTPEGYRAEQGGRFAFRYLLRPSAAFDPVEAHRLGSEALTPLEVAEIGRNDRLGPGKGEGALSPESGSFLSVEPAHASLVTWKKAEDGRGTVVRLVEVGGRDGTARVASPWLRRGLVERITAVEDPEPRRRHDRALRPFGIETYRAR